MLQIYYVKLEKKVGFLIYETQWVLGTLEETNKKIESKKKEAEHENNTPSLGGVTEMREYVFSKFIARELEEKPMNFFKYMPLNIFNYLQKELSIR